MWACQVGHLLVVRLLVPHRRATKRHRRPAQLARSAHRARRRRRSGAAREDRARSAPWPHERLAHDTVAPVRFRCGVDAAPVTRILERSGKSLCRVALACAHATEAAPPSRAPRRRRPASILLRNRWRASVAFLGHVGRHRAAARARHASAYHFPSIGAAGSLFLGLRGVRWRRRILHVLATAAMDGHL